MTSFSVDMDFQGLYPRNAEELVFSGCYATQRFSYAFSSLPVDLRGEAREGFVRVRLKSNAWKGIVGADEEIGRKRIERLKELYPFFFQNYYLGLGRQLHQLSPRAGIVAALEDVQGEIGGISRVHTARVLAMAGIDGILEEGAEGPKLHIINPSIVESFSPIGIPEGTRKEPLVRGRKESFPSTRATLEKAYWTRGENWAISSSFVMPYRQGEAGDIALVVRVSGTPQGTAEDYAGLSFARALNVGVPRFFDLAAWSEGTPALFCSYEGTLTLTNFMNAPEVPPVLKYRMARLTQEMRLRLAALNHTDAHGRNFNVVGGDRAAEPEVVLTDPGGILRRTSEGEVKKTWGAPLPHSYVGSICGEPCGALSAAESLLVLEDVERRVRGVRGQTRELGKKISKAGVKSIDFTPRALNDLCDTFPAYIQCQRDVLEKQAAFEPLALRPASGREGVSVPSVALVS